MCTPLFRHNSGPKVLDIIKLPDCSLAHLSARRHSVHHGENQSSIDRGMRFVWPLNDYLVFSPAELTIPDSRTTTGIQLSIRSISRNTMHSRSTVAPPYWAICPMKWWRSSIGFPETGKSTLPRVQSLSWQLPMRRPRSGLKLCLAC